MKLQRRLIPSTSALLAFECAARLRNFSRAAAELNTSQSAISRHVASLEGRLATRLFERHNKEVKLTEAGDRFFHAVVSGLSNIQSSALAVANTSQHGQLVITCTHEISHLFVMPRFQALQQVVGDDVRIRIMTYDYDTLDELTDLSADLIFSYSPDNAEPHDRVVAFWEAVMPVCAPSYLEEHSQALAGPVGRWGELIYLNLTKQNRGWAAWEDWFSRVGTPEPAPQFLGFDNYVYLLDAAAAGRGIALGWRDLVERYLTDGTLVPLASEFVAFDRAHYVSLTQQGRERSIARRCLSFFAHAT